eukprot:scaffold1425_cov162-Chaetoceros_neogracile.AAC.3
MMHHTCSVDSHRNFVLQTRHQGASFRPLSDTIVILKPDGENYTTLLKAPQTMQLKKAPGSIKDKRFVRTCLLHRRLLAWSIRVCIQWRDSLAEEEINSKLVYY